VIEVGTRSNGLNINEGVGAMHPENMRAQVLENKADLGIAFDGDGDRVMMMDGRGDVKDGDQLLYVIACSKLKSRQLGGGLVGTLMTNLGLEVALERMGIPFLRTAVGDRYVMEKLVENHWYIGGESSGHIINLDKTTTGDGIISALQVLDWLVCNDATLTEACAGIDIFPQTMINVPIEGGANPVDSAPVRDAVAAAEAELGATGRVLLRPSGTEPLIRVMVEGEDKRQVDRIAQALAQSVSEASTAA